MITKSLAGFCCALLLGAATYRVLNDLTGGVLTRCPLRPTPGFRKADPMEKRFQVALSFPGEHRHVVAQVAERLSIDVGRERVLYDKSFEAEFTRLDLDVYLPKLYREQAELIVVFLCPEYQQKRWCRLEWRHIRQLIASADEGRVMLLSFGPPGDLSEIGILPGDGYLDISTRDPAAIAGLIMQRLHGNQPSRTAVTRKTTPATSHPAVAMWRKKLDFLLVEEAKAVGELKFSIQQNIEEAKARVRELESQA